MNLKKRNINSSKINRPINFSKHNDIKLFNYNVPPPLKIEKYNLTKKQIVPYEHFYDCIQHSLFIIDDFDLNKETIIKYESSSLKLYLTCDSNNIVYFDNFKDIKQQYFVIEQSEIENNIFYIKNKNNQYLGSPNKNNKVFLYTTKNDFTKWNIERKTSNNFVFNYVGEKFDKNEINIVVARYNEDINWLIPYNDIAIIYNKGKDDIEYAFDNIINISNIGREGHTYLYYIINKYDNLPKRTIFTQGSPLLHNETLLYGFDNYNKLLPVQPMGLQWLKSENIPPSNIVVESKIKTDYGFEYLIMETNGDLISPLFHDEGATKFVYNYEMEHGDKYNKDLTLISNFFINADVPYIRPIIDVSFSYCGLFSVTDNVIKNKSKTFYTKLINHLTERNLQGGVNGYILEKSWFFIFNTENWYFDNEPNTV